MRRRHGLEEAARGDDEDDDDGPDTPPKPDKQTGLTDPESAVMRKSARHEYRQAYNGQAIAGADGSQLALAANVLSTPDDRQGFDGFADRLCERAGKPDTFPADAGYAGEEIVTALQARGIEPLIAIGRQQAPRANTISARRARGTNRHPGLRPRGEKTCRRNFKPARQRQNTESENPRWNRSSVSSNRFPDLQGSICEACKT